ncbi:uncharacterized protein KY384_005305 [Bacidia gigantensis]|uniref:uncharacterized protein n=1 Tax=Bacidia gigantensis TaxID=2732470 RepID=UPI001D046556|nr:uncharacterized protein KY384_005305 [Bacidia gigantensis]KAG8529824.1 hypothetical protein KY384_005305 [Bacidia gigantensis]
MLKPTVPRLLRCIPKRKLLKAPYRRYATSDRTSDRVATNDPSPPAPTQNVSDSNAVPISPQGLRDSDQPLQELPEDSERQRVSNNMFNIKFKIFATSVLRSTRRMIH